MFVLFNVSCFQAKCIIPMVNLFQTTEIGLDFVRYMEMNPMVISTPRNKVSHKTLKNTFPDGFTSDSSYGTPAEDHSMYFPVVKKVETFGISSKYREPVHYATESNTSDTDSPCWTDQEVELYHERYNPKDRRVSGILHKGGALLNNRDRVPSLMQNRQILRERKINRNNKFNQARRELKQSSAGNSLQHVFRESQFFELNNDLTFHFQEQHTKTFERNDLTFLVQDQCVEKFDEIMLEPSNNNCDSNYFELNQDLKFCFQDQNEERFDKTIQKFSISRVDSNFESNKDLNHNFQNKEKFYEILKQKSSKAPFDVTEPSSPDLVKSLFRSKIYYGATPFHSRRLPKIIRTFCRKTSIRLSRKSSIRLNRKSRKLRKSEIPNFDKISTLAILVFLWNHPNISCRVFVMILAVFFLVITFK